MTPKEIEALWAKLEPMKIDLADHYGITNDAVTEAFFQLLKGDSELKETDAEALHSLAEEFQCLCSMNPTDYATSYAEAFENSMSDSNENFQKSEKLLPLVNSYEAAKADNKLEEFANDFKQKYRTQDIDAVSGEAGKAKKSVQSEYLDKMAGTLFPCYTYLWREDVKKNIYDEDNHVKEAFLNELGISKKDQTFWSMLLEIPSHYAVNNDSDGFMKQFSNFLRPEEHDLEELKNISESYFTYANAAKKFNPSTPSAKAPSAEEHTENDVKPQKAPGLHFIDDPFHILCHELIQAKSGVNSSQFKRLRRYVDTLDRKLVLDGVKPTDKDLQFLSKMIDAYMRHKARTGVNSHAERKLIAVEKLSQYLSKGTDTDPDYTKADDFVWPAYLQYDNNYVCMTAKEGSRENFSANALTTKRYDDACLRNACRKLQDKTLIKLAVDEKKAAGQTVSKADLMEAQNQIAATGNAAAARMKGNKTADDFYTEITRKSAADTGETVPKPGVII